MHRLLPVTVSLSTVSSLSSLYSHLPTFHGTSPTFPCLLALPPMCPLLSSLSCVQIDQPEFDILLQQEQEQKVYAQVRCHTTCTLPPCPPSESLLVFVTKIPLLQILREYVTYLNRLGTLLGSNPQEAQQHASWSIVFTSRLFQFLRPQQQQQAQDKLFHVVTIDELQVPKTEGLGTLCLMVSQTFIFF